MIDSSLSIKVLTIGPKYTEKGGIASVVNSYLPMYSRFNFIASYVSGNIIKKILNLFLSLFKLIYWCIFKNIKIVHIHTASNTDFIRSSIYVYISRLFQKQVILHIHGGKFEDFYLKNKRLVKTTCIKCQALVTVSNYFVCFLKNTNLNNNIFLIPNCINEPSRTLIYSKAKEPLNLLYMGKIDENKGIFHLLEIISKNKCELVGKVILNIAGNGDVNRLSKIIEENDMQGYVKYHGWADENKKNELLSVSDVYIQLSEFESFGISILEAMSYGLPIITTGVGGVTDLVEDKINGLIVKREDDESIRKAIMFFVDNVFVRKKNGIESINKSKQYFPNKIEEKLNNMYKILLTK